MREENERRKKHDVSAPEKTNGITIYLKNKRYLFWYHVEKLIFWAFKSEKRTNYEGTPNSEADSKLLRL